MREGNDSTTAQALENLQRIKSGEDPREGAGERGRSQTKVEKVQLELDRLFAEHEMPDRLDRSDVHGYVADWQRKIGNAKYNTYIEPKEYGERITGRERASGQFSVGVALRAFDSKDTWVDTVAHELAHVTAYVMEEYGGYGNSPGHGTGWKIEADRLGADPTRTDRVAPENRVEPNYIVECVECGYTWERQRRSKIVKHPGRYSCGDCGGSLESREA